MNRGKVLKPGDTIALTAPASPLSRDELTRVISILESLGFNLKIGESCVQKYGGYLAGTAKERAEELESFFVDPSVQAIVCLRGGYGSMQLLNLLDYELIGENPKLFVGYSDITALHLAFLQKANLATIHGPMAATDLARGMPKTSWSYFWKLLTVAKPLGELENPSAEELICIVPGKAEGTLVGGNLSILSATMGTPYELDTEGKILFLEDIGEEPYKIDRMFTQLALAGKFAACSGIILGTWTNCTSARYPDSFTVLDLAREIIAPYGKPTLYNLQAGHGRINLPLPLGVKATLDATNKRLVIEERVADD